MYLCGCVQRRMVVLCSLPIGWLALAGTPKGQEARGACPGGCQEGTQAKLLVARPLQRCTCFFAAYSHAAQLQCAQRNR